MANWFAALLFTLSLAAGDRCFAQDYDDFPDSRLTREQWQQRLEDARRRTEEFVARALTQSAEPPVSDIEEAEAADRRAMNDPTLQHGDIIATSHGFVMFVGRSEGHQSSDFLAVPKSSGSSPP
jgi:hypothetical protein